MFQNVVLFEKTISDFLTYHLLYSKKFKTILPLEFKLMRVLLETCTFLTKRQRSKWCSIKKGGKGGGGGVVSNKDWQYGTDVVITWVWAHHHQAQPSLFAWVFNHYTKYPKNNYYWKEYSKTTFSAYGWDFSDTGQTIAWRGLSQKGHFPL